MIDKGKKTTFYFLQNVWKCTVFFAFAFKVCKKCYYDPKFFFLEYITMGIKNAEFYADFKFVDAGFKKWPYQKLKATNQRIWNQHKILRFLIPIVIFFKKKFVLVIIALFAYFKCKCEKNCTFSNILQKIKSYFCNIYHSPFDSH